MKYIKFILLFVFIFSCSNESEDSENNSALLGTWRSVWTGECLSNDCQLHECWDSDDGEIFATKRLPILVLNDNSMDLIIEMSQSEGYIGRTSWNKVN